MQQPLWSKILRPRCRRPVCGAFVQMSHGPFLRTRRTHRKLWIADGAVERVAGAHIVAVLGLWSQLLHEGLPQQPPAALYPCAAPRSRGLEIPVLAKTLQLQCCSQRPPAACGPAPTLVLAIKSIHRKSQHLNPATSSCSYGSRQSITASAQHPRA